jgi:hypothetical protein
LPTDLLGIGSLMGKGFGAAFNMFSLTDDDAAKEKKKKAVYFGLIFKIYDQRGIRRIRPDKHS